MSLSHSLCKDAIRARAVELGAAACGFARAEPVDADAIAVYDHWIASGRNASMLYCARYRDLRVDPRLLLDGARTIISCAFGYYTGDCKLPLAQKSARYAWGLDYHWVLRSKLNDLAAFVKDKYGGECRVCVDTAPIRERYWAVASGIGFVGINNQLIVPGYGAYVFLGELLWTGTVEPDSPHRASCGDCGACVVSCPTHALDGAGGCDARRCLSYLSIEHRGQLPDGTDLHGMWYGCDRCLAACPHNRNPRPSAIPDFQPYAALMSLTQTDIEAMSTSHFKRLTLPSAMSRVSLAQLKRNINNNQH